MEIANTYTYRQAMLLGEYLIKEKFMIVTELMGAFTKNARQCKPSSNPARTSILPSWYRRPNTPMTVIDLDGPISALRPFLGKSRLKEGLVKKLAR